MRSSFSRIARGASGANLLMSAAAAVLLAGCSSSADRLTNNASSNDPIYTASVPENIQENDAGGGSMVASRPLDNSSVTSRPLNYANNARNYESQQQGYANPPPVYRQQTYQQPTYQQPAYQQPSYQQPNPVYAPQPQVANVEAPATVAEGGEVQIEPGMTLFSVARANKVSVRALAEANNISPPYAVQIGQVIRIPGVQHAQAPQMPSRTIVASNRVPAVGGAHKVQPGETLYSLGRKYGVSPYAIANANQLSASSTLSVGQSLRIPTGNGNTHLAAAAPAEQAEDNPPTVNQQAMTGNGEDDSPAPQASADLSAPKDQSQIVQNSASDTPAAADPSMPGFRWPVKGKVISEYGAKPNGLRNEGINIAVPEGTSVRAADDGVIAYAGNELKGYGNLVLIRHEGGWVTAYAHNKELFVKRGDTVKRGDVVAKAGQTGSVSSPQVHFEIRKGATAVDPLRLLTAATAAN